MDHSQQQPPRSSSSSSTPRPPLTKEEIWDKLFQRVTLSLDDVYTICEYESSLEQCRKVRQLLEVNVEEFQELEHNIEVLHSEKNKPIAWQVRKTDLSSPSRRKPFSFADAVKQGNTQRSRTESAGQSQNKRPYAHILDVYRRLESFSTPVTISSSHTTSGQWQVSSGNDTSFATTESRSNQHETTLTEPPLHEWLSDSFDWAEQAGSGCDSDISFETESSKNGEHSIHTPPRTKKLAWSEDSNKAQPSHWLSQDKEQDAARRHSRESSGGSETGQTSPPRGPRLHAKLSSPERQKPSPEETERKAYERQVAAEANKAKIEHKRLVKLQQQQERVNTVKRNHEAKRAIVDAKSTERLEKAEARKEQHMRNVRQKAASQNKKVEEVSFINDMNLQDKKLEIRSRMEAGETRREENLASIREKAAQKNSKVEEKAELQRKREEEEAEKLQAKLESRLANGDTRRKENLHNRVNKSTNRAPNSVQAAWRLDGQQQVTRYQSYAAVLQDDVNDESSEYGGTSASTRISKINLKAGEDISNYPIGTSPESCKRETKKISEAQKSKRKKVRKLRAQLSGFSLRFRWHEEKNISTTKRSRTNNRLHKLINEIRSLVKYNELVKAAKESSGPSACAICSAAGLVRDDNVEAAADTTALLNLPSPLPESLGKAFNDVLRLLDSTGNASVTKAVLPEQVLQGAFEMRKSIDEEMRKASGLTTGEDDILPSEFQHPVDYKYANENMKTVHNSSNHLRDDPHKADETGGSGHPQTAVHFSVEDAKALRVGGVLHIAASCCIPEYVNNQPDIVVKALRVLILSSSLPSNCNYFMRCNFAVPVVDILGLALDKLPLAAMGIPEEVLNRRQNEPDEWESLLSQFRSFAKNASEKSWPVDKVTETSTEVSLVMASLQLLWLQYRHVPCFPCGSENDYHAQKDYSLLLVKYIVHSSLLNRIRDLFWLLRSAPTMMALSPLIRTILAFLVALTDDRDIRKEPIYSSRQGGNVLVNVFQDTGIMGVPTLLSGLLLAVSPASRARARARLADSLGTHSSPASNSSPSCFTDSDMDYSDRLWRLPSSAVSTAILALKVLNNAARIDVKLLQTQLSSTGSDLETYHIIEHLLGHVAGCIPRVPNAVNDISSNGTLKLRAIPWDASHELLAELMLLIGYLSYGNPKMQELVHWGHSPTPLQRICRMPFRLFIHPTDRDIILPTLLCCLDNCPTNRIIITTELDSSFLIQYIRERRQQRDPWEEISPHKTPSYFELHNRLSSSQLEHALMQLSDGTVSND